MSIDFFFFNDTATTEIYTLSLHDALPIFGRWQSGRARVRQPGRARRVRGAIEELVLGRDVALRIEGRGRQAARVRRRRVARFGYWRRRGADPRLGLRAQQHRSADRVVGDGE